MNIRDVLAKWIPGQIAMISITETEIIATGLLDGSRAAEFRIPRGDLQDCRDDVAMLASRVIDAIIAQVGANPPSHLFKVSATDPDRWLSGFEREVQRRTAPRRSVGGPRPIDHVFNCLAHADSFHYGECFGPGWQSRCGARFDAGGGAIFLCRFQQNHDAAQSHGSAGLDCVCEHDVSRRRVLGDRMPRNSGDEPCPIHGWL